MLSRLTRTRPVTGSLKIEVRTISSRHSTSRGSPTLMDMTCIGFLAADYRIRTRGVTRIRPQPGLRTFGVRGAHRHRPCQRNDKRGEVYEPDSEIAVVRL